MGAEEILQVAGFGLVDGAAGIHALYDGGNITEHQGVHESCVEK